MQRLLSGILRILDGSPQARNRGGQAGQSLVELAFITPLLAIMIVGIVEIGGYANRFLILLEVSRVGARNGSVLTGDLNPLTWNEAASVHPIVYTEGFNLTAASIPPDARNYRNCSSNATGYYKAIACTMVNSMLPLTLKGRAADTTDNVGKNVYDRSGNLVATVPYPDDIVISLFSLQAVNNADPTSITIPNQTADLRGYQLASILFSRTFNFNDPRTLGRYPAGSQVIAVGRYPKSANECNWFQTGGTRSVIPGTDPFDYLTDNVQNTVDILGQQRNLELVGMDPNNVAEAQLGFVWTGQHRRTGIVQGASTAVCWGSEFDSSEIVALMNLPNFVDADIAGRPPWMQQRAAIPSQGVVVVELFWQHKTLLDFPFVEPIIAMFGDTNNIIISAWAAFPVPSVEPNIVYRLAS